MHTYMHVFFSDRSYDRPRDALMIDATEGAKDSSNIGATGGPRDASKICALGRPRASSSCSDWSFVTVLLEWGSCNGSSIATPD